MKKLIVFTVLVLTSIGVFAQLTVKPTSNNKDSYIYVKDEILFVEGNIHLVENVETRPGFDKHASINLREGAQLIQGGTTSNNTGDGFLSVQQTVPETNARAYTYWASPVGNPAADVSYPEFGTNTNFGVNSIYENLVPQGLAAKQVLHTPALDGSLNPLTISTRWLYTHEEPGTEAEGDYNAMDARNSAKAGFGFTMKGVGGGLNQTISQLYEFRGRPNNGDFTIPVKGPHVRIPNSAPASADVEANMTLSGNPYPSALDLNWLFWEPGNESLAAFYYYDENRNTYSHHYNNKPFGYGVFVPGPEDSGTSEQGYFTNATFYHWNSQGGSTETGQSGTISRSHRFAPIGQGIMFVGVNSDERNVTIKNSHRRYIKQGTPNSIFHRPNSESGDMTSDLSNQDVPSEEERANALAQLDNRTPQTRLHVIFNEELTRDMLLTFSDQSSDGYDRGMDGPHPGGMKSDAYFPIVMNNESRPHVIYSTNFSVEKQIPIDFKMDVSGTIRIVISEVIRKPYSKMYLFDQVESTFRELRGGSIAGVTMSLPTGDYYNRFFIVFQKEEALPYPKADLDEFIANIGLFQNNPIQRLQVLNPEGYNIKSVNVFDMSGKLVISEKNLGDNTSYSFYTGHLSDGVYLVKLLSQDNMSLDYKAIIMNK
jgi:hypothetical protein